LLAVSVTTTVLLSELLPPSREPVQPALPDAVVGHMKPAFGSACNVIAVPTAAVIVLLAEFPALVSVALAGLVTDSVHHASKLASVSVAVCAEPREWWEW
jgi:hypothetical protein